MKVLSIRWWLFFAWLATAILGNLFFEIGSRLLGSVQLFAAAGDDVWRFVQFALPLFLLLLPALVIGWFLERMVLRPLAAMSHAAQQIARGDLDFSLPPARLREVAEVFAAFDAMGQALRLSIERQANLEQERRLFISAIAHDLRTPLFALRGYLEGLATGIASTPEKRAHYLVVCQEQGALLEQRIANLFAYARLEYLDQAPRRQSLDLCLLLKKTVERFLPHLEAKEITLELKHQEGRCMIAVDKQLLTRLFDNLLDNAVRHTPGNGRIAIELIQEAGGVIFKIIDSGPGISPTALPHLFMPHYHSELSSLKSSSHNPGGAGLGLTIAHQIAKAHGGTLTAKNGEKGGAEFQLWLPDSKSDETL